MRSVTGTLAPGERMRGSLGLPRILMYPTGLEIPIWVIFRFEVPVLMISTGMSWKFPFSKSSLNRYSPEESMFGLAPTPSMVVSVKVE